MDLFGYSKKDFNSYLLLNLLQKHGALSRTQLSNITGMLPATVSNITREYIDEGILCEAGATTGGRGRSQTLLQLDQDLCAIGVNIESDRLTVILSNITGNVLCEIKRTYTRNDDPQYIVELLLNCIPEALKSHPDKRVVGIAVGDPGTVDSSGEHSALSSQLFNWKKISLKQHIQTHYNLPVFVEMNDRLKALAEMKYGAAIGCRNFICLHLGYGVGMSLISEGRLIRGKNGYAGEFGHIASPGSNALCLCGSRGCLETHTSLSHLLQSLQAALDRGIWSILDQLCPAGQPLAVEHIQKALERGDRLTENYVQDVASRLGDATAQIVTLLNPQMVIFQGQMCVLGDPLIKGIEAVIRQRAFPFALKDLEFCVSKLGDLAGPLGAATVVFDDFLHTKFFEDL